MADKQISALTEVSSPATTDLYVCQQSTTAKKITLNSIRTFIQKFTNASTVTAPNDSDYLHLNTSGGVNRKITAANFKNYCGGSSGGSGALYAVYGTTTYSAIMSAISGNKAVWCVDDMVYAPLVEVNELMPGDEYISFLDIANQKYLVVSSANAWSRVSM